MPSRIYAAGVRATAVANIVADAAAWFYVDQGRKVLDMAQVADYLAEKFRTLATDEGYAVDSVQDVAARSVSVYQLGQALDTRVGLGALRARSDYPNEGNVTQASIIAAVNAGRARTDARAAELTALYAWTQSTALNDFIQNFYREKNIDAAVPAGVTRILDTRTYRYAYRTDKGEISKPSDASALRTLDQNDSMEVTATTPPVGSFVDSVLWYRSLSGDSSAAFKFVDEKTVASGLTYTDTKIGEELGESCPSIEWDAPNADLRGMRMHPNGFGVAFFKNTVCFSVQNRLYAWPITWRKTTRKPIVGLEIGGQTAFIGTQGEPVLMTGADPAFMAAERVTGGDPCRSARSIVATKRGFMYAGGEGIVLCNGTAGGTPTVTESHFTKEQWEALLPSSIFAVEHDGCYIFWWNNGVTSGCYSLGIDTGRLATLDIVASTVFRNTSNGKLYGVSGTQIVEVFGGATKRVGYWKSPRVAGRSGFAWLRAKGDYEAGNVTVRWYQHLQDGTSATKTYTVTSRRPQRTHVAPAGMDEYEIEVEGQSAVTELLLTDSSEALK